MVLEEKQLTFETIKRDLFLLIKEVFNTKKQITKTMDASSKIQNRAGSASIKNVAEILSNTGILNQIGGVIQDSLGVIFKSTIGSDGGNGIHCAIWYGR